MTTYRAVLPATAHRERRLGAPHPTPEAAALDAQSAYPSPQPGRFPPVIPVVASTTNTGAHGYALITGDVAHYIPLSGQGADQPVVAYLDAWPLRAEAYLDHASEEDLDLLVNECGVPKSLHAFLHRAAADHGLNLPSDAPIGVDRQIESYRTYLKRRFPTPERIDFTDANALNRLRLTDAALNAALVTTGDPNEIEVAYLHLKDTGETEPLDLRDLLIADNEDELGQMLALEEVENLPDWATEFFDFTGYARSKAGAYHRFTLGDGRVALLPKHR